MALPSWWTPPCPSILTTLSQDVLSGVRPESLLVQLQSAPFSLSPQRSVFPADAASCLLCHSWCSEPSPSHSQRSLPTPSQERTEPTLCEACPALPDATSSSITCFPRCPREAGEASGGPCALRGWGHERSPELCSQLCPLLSWSGYPGPPCAPLQVHLSGLQKLESPCDP